MLVIAQKTGETFQIGDSIIQVQEAHEGKVRLAIESNSAIRRQAVLDAVLANLGWESCDSGFKRRRGGVTCPTLEILTRENLLGHAGSVTK